MPSIIRVSLTFSRNKLATDIYYSLNKMLISDLMYGYLLTSIVVIVVLRWYRKVVFVQYLVHCLPTNILFIGISLTLSLMMHGGVALRLPPSRGAKYAVSFKINSPWTRASLAVGGNSRKGTTLNWRGASSRVFRSLRPSSAAPSMSSTLSAWSSTRLVRDTCSIYCLCCAHLILRVPKLGSQVLNKCLTYARVYLVKREVLFLSSIAQQYFRV